jgi:C4-dicarboxylate-specific signal transduction histidine kinase
VAEVDWGESATAGLAFFCKMSACISHDIKNHLAIINEKAGLCGDLLFMAEQKGRPLDSEMIKELAQNIGQQVKRADEVVKNLNRLAHSVDEPCCSVDLDQMVALIVSISQRLVSAKGIRVKTNLPTSAVEVESSPFFLMYIIFYFIDKVMGASNNGEMQISLEDVGDAGQITISGSFEGMVRSTEAMPTPISDLEEKLGVTVDLEGNMDEVVIRVPKAFRLKNADS